MELPLIPLVFARAIAAGVVKEEISPWEFVCLCGVYSQMQVFLPDRPLAVGAVYYLDSFCSALLVDASHTYGLGCPEPN